MGAEGEREKDKEGLTLSSENPGTALVVQWLGICSAMQGTQIQSLVWEHKIPHAAEKFSPYPATAEPLPVVLAESLYASMKDPACCKEDPTQLNK